MTHVDSGVSPVQLSTTMSGCPSGQSWPLLNRYLSHGDRVAAAGGGAAPRAAAAGVAAVAGLEPPALVDDAGAAVVRLRVQTTPVRRILFGVSNSNGSSSKMPPFAGRPNTAPLAPARYEMAPISLRPASS